MTDTRKAMQQALEALEHIDTFGEPDKRMPAAIEAFTIEDVSTNRAMLATIAKEKNKRSTYLWTVGKLTVKEATNGQGN